MGTAVGVYVTITCSSVIFILINMKRNKFIHHSLKKRLQSFYLHQCYFTSAQDTMQLSKIVQACDMGYLKGKGGRYANNEMTHLRMAFVGHQKGLWPPFVLGAVGASFTLWYMQRLATKSCDVNWTKAKDDSVTNHYWNKQAKFFNPGNFDYSTLNNGIPKYQE